ncbi:MULTISPECIES: hypothetical protein [Bacillus cereus group]|uniref:Uncharacterized protein n=3 Tax=root TaxID=1 RepID=A0A9X6ZQF0_BACTU|nr:MULTISPECIES: hypothetical protein [Bacillus cereus group]ANN33598.1 hypothetical protein A9498_19770 [Bacillus thuringiensis serovar coreanensis]ASL65311.1 hypothetical protein FORC47_2466 [Bacillus cereus]KAA1808138.1 hypothetical protein FXB61_001004 [Bacillus cereus]MDA1564673.1 hypothetical protein [Bacillus cereus]MDA1925221.1 hypothetical protein [Bacillus cereus]
MTRHYLINTLVNWRESNEKFHMNYSLQHLKDHLQTSDEEALETYQEELVPLLSMGYNWYEYKHPKLRELLGEW